MKYLVLDVRPEFVEGIAAPTAKEAEPDANRRVAGCVVPRRAPGVGQEVDAGDLDEPRIRKRHSTIAVLCQKGHLGGMSYSIHEGSTGIPSVTGVLTPNCTQPRFHRVTHRKAAEPHTISIAKTFPM